jgi:hypothetical protein
MPVSFAEALKAVSWQQPTSWQCHPLLCGGFLVCGPGSSLRVLYIMITSPFLRWMLFMCSWQQPICILTVSRLVAAFIMTEPSTPRWTVECGGYRSVLLRLHVASIHNESMTLSSIMIVFSTEVSRIRKFFSHFVLIIMYLCPTYCT